MNHRKAIMFVSRFRSSRSLKSQSNTCRSSCLMRDFVVLTGASASSSVMPVPRMFLQQRHPFSSIREATKVFCSARAAKFPELPPTSRGPGYRTGCTPLVPTTSLKQLPLPFLHRAYFISDRSTSIVLVVILSSLAMRSLHRHLDTVLRLVITPSLSSGCIISVHLYDNLGERFERAQWKDAIARSCETFSYVSAAHVFQLFHSLRTTVLPSFTN